jgi:hypothetical protein
MMTPTIDYKCRYCQRIEHAEIAYGNDIPEALEHYCFQVQAHWPMQRVWSAPHTGRGSSGEKPK